MSRRSTTLADLGILAIRIVIGVVFVFHGCQKLFGLFDGPGLVGFAKQLAALEVPYPAIAAVLGAGTEFLGGLAIITGYGLRIAAIPLIVNMATASILMHRHAFSFEHGGMEYPLTLTVVIIGLACLGPGRVVMPEISRAKSQSPAAEQPTMRRRHQPQVVD